MVTLPARISTAIGERPHAEAEVRTNRNRGVSLPELLDQLACTDGDACSHIRLQGAVGSETATRFS